MNAQKVFETNLNAIESQVNLEISYLPWDEAIVPGTKITCKQIKQFVVVQASMPSKQLISLVFPDGHIVKFNSNRDYKDWTYSCKKPDQNKVKNTPCTIIFEPPLIPAQHPIVLKWTGKNILFQTEDPQTNERKPFLPPLQAQCHVDAEHLFSVSQAALKLGEMHDLKDYFKKIDLIRASQTSVCRSRNDQIFDRDSEDGAMNGALEIIDLINESIPAQLPSFLTSSVQLPNSPEKKYYVDNISMMLLYFSMTPNGVEIKRTMENAKFFLELFENVITSAAFYDRDDIYNRRNELKNEEILSIAEKITESEFEGRFKKIFTRHRTAAYSDNIQRYNRLIGFIKMLEEFHLEERYSKKDRFGNKLPKKQPRKEESIIESKTTFNHRLVWKIITCNMNQCGIDVEVSKVVYPEILNILNIEQFSIEDYQNVLNGLKQLPESHVVTTYTIFIENVIVFKQKMDQRSFAIFLFETFESLFVNAYLPSRPAKFTPRKENEKRTSDSILNQMINSLSSKTVQKVVEEFNKYEPESIVEMNLIWNNILLSPDTKGISDFLAGTLLTERFSLYFNTFKHIFTCIIKDRIRFAAIDKSADGSSDEFMFGGIVVLIENGLFECDGLLSFYRSELCTISHDKAANALRASFLKAVAKTTNFDVIPLVLELKNSPGIHAFVRFTCDDILAMKHVVEVQKEMPVVIEVKKSSIFDFFVDGIPPEPRNSNYDDYNDILQRKLKIMRSEEHQTEDFIAGWLDGIHEGFLQGFQDKNDGCEMLVFEDYQEDENYSQEYCDGYNCAWKESYPQGYQ